MQIDPIFVDHIIALRSYYIDSGNYTELQIIACVKNILQNHEHYSQVIVNYHMIEAYKLLNLYDRYSRLFNQNIIQPNNTTTSTMQIPLLDSVTSIRPVQQIVGRSHRMNHHEINNNLQNRDIDFNLIDHVLYNLQRGNNHNHAQEDVKLVLTEEEFNKLEKIKILENTEEICPICKIDYDENDTLVKLPCDHSFHEDCIKIWLTRHSYKCPTCRRPAGIQTILDE